MEGSGSLSNCEPPPGQKHAEASIILFYFIFQGTFKEHSGNRDREHSGKSREHSGNIQGTFREHSGNIQGTFREHSGNIQERFREQGQGTFREHSRNIRGLDYDQQESACNSLSSVVAQASRSTHTEPRFPTVPCQHCPEGPETHNREKGLGGSHSWTTLVHHWSVVQVHLKTHIVEAGCCELIMIYPCIRGALANYV
jgi:hypothetical protein